MTAVTDTNELDGVAGLESWRWLFIIEGLMPIVMSVPVYFMLLSFPEDSKALSDRGMRSVFDSILHR